MNGLNRYAFTVGFCKRMAAHGVDPQELGAALRKQAGDSKWKDFFTSPGTVKSVNDIMFKWGPLLAAFLAAPVGWHLGQRAQVSSNDLEFVRNRALLNEYMAAADRLQAAKRMETLPS